MRCAQTARDAIRGPQEVQEWRPQVSRIPLGLISNATASLSRLRCRQDRVYKGEKLAFFACLTLASVLSCPLLAAAPFPSSDALQSTRRTTLQARLMPGSCCLAEHPVLLRLCGLKTRPCAAACIVGSRARCTVLRNPSALGERRLGWWYFVQAVRGNWRVGTDTLTCRLTVRIMQRLSRALRTLAAGAVRFLALLSIFSHQ